MNYTSNTSNVEINVSREDKCEITSQTPKRETLTFWHSNHENIFALTIAIIASFLAINELISGKYGDDEIILTNEKSSAFLWYQSKSIKEYVVKGQLDMLSILISADSFKSKELPLFKNQQIQLENNLKRYQKEKNEILVGSKSIGKENWAQEVDGQLGNVVGAKEIEKQLSVLSKAGDRFDIASLFLQLSLVLGALGILVKKLSIKTYSIIGTIFMASLGIFFSINGLIIVSSF